MNSLNLIIILFFLFGEIVNAQVAIGKEYTGNPSVILEFNDTRNNAKNSNGETTVSINGDNKSLILPVVSSLNADTGEGAIWFDAVEDKVKYRTQTGDVDMTSTSSIDISSPLAENNELQDLGSGTIIGAETSQAKGILILESNSQAMVLPVVTGLVNVKNPEPGSLVYDRLEKSIAVFNGSTWTYWGDY